MIGANPEFLDDIPKRTRVRIAVKGHNDQTFEQITGASNGLELQLKAIQALEKP